MRALVVGGAGFIGSHLVDRLLAERSVVDVVDDLSGGSLANLSDARSETLGELRIHTLDVRDPALIDLVAQRPPEVIFGLVDVCRDDRSAVEVLVSGCLNLVDAAARSQVRKLVVVLDAMALHGVVNAAELPLKDGRAYAPDSLRGIAMRTMIDVLTLSRQRSGVEFTALALSTVYGLRQRPDRGVVAAFIDAQHAGRPAEVHGDGRQTRDFLFVDDAVDAIVRASSRGGGLVINVGTGVQTSIRALERLIMTDGGSAPTRVARNDDSRFAVSPVRARIQLAWAPWTDLADGVGQLLG